MNRQLKSAINKFCYKLGLNHYEERRNEMINRATTIAKAGISLQAIILELGIPMPQEQEKTAQEAETLTRKADS